MNKQNINSKKGFTIIEVVLVLAIAGLIFLMVFIAYPALRRSQDDTQRRNDMSRVLSQLDTYKTNNRRMPSVNGALSTCTTTEGTESCTRGSFIDDYLNGENFVDPDGEQYYIMDQGQIGTTTGSGTSATTVRNPEEPANKPDHIIYYYTGATCQGETVVPSTGKGKNDVAIVYFLANGRYCGTNAEAAVEE